MANLLGTTTIGGHQAIHVGNISSYAGISTATGDARYLQLSGGTLTGGLNISAGGVIQLYTSGGSLRGYFQATDSDDNHLIIATSGGEDIVFKDAGLSGTRNFVIRGNNVGSEAYGSMRAPIFYDSNDTNYYLDPNSTSRVSTLNVVSTLNTGNVIMLGYNIDGSISTSAFRGINFHTFSDLNYYIGKPEGSWTQPLDIHFYTGIRLKSHGSYGGTRFINLSSGNTLMTVGDGTDYVKVTEKLEVSSTMNINYDQVWTSSGNLHLQYSSSGNIDMNYGGGYTFSRTSLRAPIFYDYNDPNYYLDPNAGTSGYLAGVLRQNNGKYVRDSAIQTFSGQANYYSGGEAGWYRVAEIALTGNCGGAVIYGTLYDNRYDGADTYQIAVVARSECNFTSDNESHYINVGCTILGSTNYTNYRSKIRVLLVESSTNLKRYELQFYETNWNNDTWQLESTGWTVYTSAQAPRASIGGERVNYISNHNADYLRANSSTYSPIYYDSEDTGYYVDPNSESKLRKLWINNGGAGGVGWSTGLNMGDGSNYWNLIQDGGIARQRNFGTGGYDWWSSTAGTQLMLLSNAGNLSVHGSITTGGNAVIHAGNIGSQSVTYANSAGSASSATTATNLGADYTADDWFRATADNNPVKFYGNSYQMTWRTDGASEAYSGIGGYPFVWTYGGSSAGNRRMLMDTSGNLWTNTYGWLHDYFQLASSAINTGNIGSQSVSYAATAGSADNIDGWGFRNTGSNDSVNADTIDSNGITYYTGGVPNFSGNATDGALYSQRYSGSWQHQIAGDYRSGQIALRGRNNGTWQAWRTVLDSANASYAAAMNQNVRTDSDPTFNSTYFANGNLRLYQGGGTALHIQTAYGYGVLGPQNGSWFHFETDRANFYFGRSVYVNGSVHIYGGSQLVENNGATWNISVGGNSATTSQRSYDYLYASSYLESSGAVYGTIFYDNDDRGYYVDPNGTSNLNKLSARTMSYNDMNSMSVNSPYVDRYNGSSLYRNGTMGYGTTDFNVMFSNWGSGFIDSWSSPANAPGGSSHYVGLQGFHYNHVNNSQAYGFQMACAGEADNRFFWRSAWPNLRSWVEMMHTGNSPYAWNMNQYVRTSDAPTFSGVYTNDWFRANGCTGLYFQTYGYGLRAPECEGNSYGNVATYATGRNGWSGYGIGSQYVIMGRVGVDVGLHDNNFGWGWYWHSGNRSLGIGESSTSSGYRLYVTGAIYATDDIVAYSDARKKTNIETIPEALDTVMKLRGVFYDRTDSMEKGRQLGVIAQEVNAVLPEAVSYAEDTDEYGVKYGNIVGVLIEAIKEQQAQIDELKKRLGE